jgi:hypothetical protein
MQAYGDIYREGRLGTGKIKRINAERSADVIKFG